MPDPRLIYTNGWRQGKLVRLEDSHTVLELVEYVITESSRLIVISQDCDLVHNSYKNEPFVELIVAEPIAVKCDKSLTHGKNPRKLHFSLVNNGDLTSYQCLASSKISIPRVILESIVPCEEVLIIPEELQILKRWLSSRYSRTAFPDALNDRINPVRQDIEKILKSNGEKITAIYIFLDPWNEIPEGYDYNIAIYGAMLVNDYSEEECLQSVTEAIEGIAVKLNECAGINVVDYSARSESDITLSDLRMLVQWNYEYLSYRDKPGGELPIA